MSLMMEKCKNVIKWPDKEEYEYWANEFQKQGKWLPNCIAAIDGMHVCVAVAVAFTQYIFRQLAHQIKDSFTYLLDGLEEPMTAECTEVWGFQKFWITCCTYRGTVWRTVIIFLVILLARCLIA